MELSREQIKDILSAINELYRDRDDLLVGVAAAILDQYRMSFEGGSDTKAEAVTRLRAQARQLDDAANGLGTKSLRWLADSIENDKLDAAWLLRQRPAGLA